VDQAGLSGLLSACQVVVMAVSKEPVAWTGWRAVVALPEHVDRSNAAQIREQLLAVFDRGAVVVIADMSATAWCEGSGHRAAW
jgi:hypothetical protein